MSNNKTVTRWSRLLLGAVSLLFAGIIYAWSVIKSPFGSGGFGWSNSALGLNYTITMCMFCLGGLFSGLLAKKVSVKVRMTASAVLITAGMFITSLLDGSTPALLYVGYGLMMGLGVGIVYNIVVALTNAWFPDKKGVASGVLMMTFGFSSLLFGKVADYMFSTEIGWSNTYRILGIAIGIVTLVVGLLIRGPKEDEIAPFLAAVKAKKTGTAVAEEKDYTAAEMLKRPSFWKLFVFFVLLTAVGGVALSFGKDIFLSVNVESTLAVTIASLLAIFNGVGRLCSGAIFDALGIRRTQFVTSAVVITASALTTIGIAVNSSVLSIIGVCLCAFSYGFAPTVSAAFAGAFYGRKNFALNFSILNLILIPSAFYSTVAGSIVDSTGGFLVVFIILTVFSVIGLIDNIFIKRP